ncbi:phage tail sheath C-terminal domain-containing protein [Pseudomonas sp. HR96]|uniref:phage tail sheath family protein n=1 Tax=Pseudomonas sp. HR96 TaxID=1027966 RepID=UPI002A7640B1|nr:phage tail sheath C-terminal domain-containing protein [Pseudomonas sp. HR96]WPO98643.1 phage tail sheath C-terminal domain-containing protein [Pseudomonas sp. HR96]
MISEIDNASSDRPTDAAPRRVSSVQAPGVYAEESNDPLLSIPAGATAIPVFIGSFRNLDGTPASTNACIAIDSYFDFQRRFAESATITVAAGAATVTVTQELGSRSLRLYFDNGGGRCFILPVATPPVTANLAAILAHQPQISLYCTTEFTEGLDPIYNALNTLLNKTGDGFLIADSPDGVLRPTTPAQRTATYYPALLTNYSSRLDDRSIVVTGLTIPGLETERLTLDLVKRYQPADYKRLSKAVDEKLKTDYPQVTLKASPAIAGVYCRIDSQQGVWKAPAGVSLNAVSDLAERVSPSVQMKLMANRINALKPFPGEGVKVWGTRTCVDPATPLWLHIPVSRLFDAAARDMQRALQFAVFLPNNEMTWNAVRGAISGYLYNLWRNGGLIGRNAEEAYYVQVGAGLSMTEEQVLGGELVVRVGMAAVRPAEFIEVLFSQQLAGV